MKIAYIITNIKSCGPYRILESMLFNNKIFEEQAVISLFGKDDANIIKQLKEKKIKVISLNLSKITFFITGKSKLRKIVKKNEFDIIHSHGLLPDILVSKLNINAKKICTLHNNMYEDYIFNFGKINGKINIIWHSSVLKKFDSVVCCSKSIYDYMKIKYVKSNLTYIRNGINYINYSDNDLIKIRYDIRKKLKISQNSKIYIYAGVLSDGKNVVNLVRSFSSIHSKNEYLIVIGDGNKFNECKVKADKNILMLGYKADAIKYVIASDVYISFSYSEGFSISVLEALMLDKTLLLSDIPSHKEIIEYFSTYCGTCFNKDSFSKEFKEIKTNIKYDKAHKYLISSERMINDYAEIYKKD